ncbi:MAG: nuclear transport factor 2 family protein [Candidatus Binataceae bacterium]|jgi:ketosteroid isomerase-like protein
MSEQTNLEIVQRGYKAYADGDLAALGKLLTDDVEWTYHPTYRGIPWAQHSWHGPDRVLQSLKVITDLVEFLVSSRTNLSSAATVWQCSATNDAG